MADNTHVDDTIRLPVHLANVRYDIRGPLARRALEMERAGQKVIKLNVGNPGAFGFRAPENIQRAVIEHLGEADPYSHQKGIMPAREAVVADVTARGTRNVGVDDVFMGNGVSELILMCMEALLEPGDEVLLPAPDYPLWTAAVTITGGKPVYYGCRPGNAFCPDPEEISRLITPRTRALVMINPNNPTGAVYPRALVEALVRIAETRKLVLFSDEIYDRILYDGAEHVPVAPLCERTLCATFGGLSKVHLACGYRVGWVTFSGRRDHAGTYLQALELLASLRLCSNVPGQWAVPAALGGTPHIAALTAPTGRLGLQRGTVLEAVRRSKYLNLVAPRGALYAFIGVKRDRLPDFRDAHFAMELLEKRQVLVVPGSSFNVDYTDHFRTTLLPDAEIMGEVFGRMESLLDEWAK